MECTLEETELLNAEFTEEEIKSVFFSMPNDKAPGPDGFTSEFFKAAWVIIGKDCLVAVKSFFIKSFLPKGLNSTILALIPKKEAAIEMRDYRPISCCNVLYKVISKLLANRLKSILPRFICLNQSAFVKDRLLIENLLLATELVKDYHKTSITPRCSMKIDISKAFDSVQWTFLFNTLSAMGFPQRYIRWIQLCVSTASFSVQINGELSGYFGSSRGLRQGCALSPYLFVICMNVLSKLLDRAAIEGRMGYHPKCRSLRLTHLSFADDILVFNDGTHRSVDATMKVFDDFAGKSGLKISIEKSTIYLAGVTAQNRESILSHFPFESSHLPVRYLGLPLLTKRMSSGDYSTLVERIRGQMSSWKARHLSYAGRLQLIKSVISGVINFWIAAFCLPADCIRQIESLCAAFLWSGPELSVKKAKVSWSDVCRPKAEGGLGVRSIKDANLVACLKLIWRIISHQPSLWVSWVYSSLLRGASFWTVKYSASVGSWIWKKLLKHRSIARDFHKVEIYGGSTTSFWFDYWSDMGVLWDLLGAGGTIDLGIPINSLVGSVLSTHRTRRHRVELLNKIESEIVSARARSSLEEDISLWRGKGNKFNNSFSSRGTWDQIRVVHATCPWHTGIWFTYATPKYSFLVWLATLNRLSTCDRMSWYGNQSCECVLCNGVAETRNHLFFECHYSATIWKALALRLFGSYYTTNWCQILSVIKGKYNDRISTFLARYVFQSTVYHIWMERNHRRHGEIARTAAAITKLIDKNIRNRLSSIRNQGDLTYSEGLCRWFSFST